MAQFDLPLAELETYRPDRREPQDFDAFWERTLAEARSHPIDLRLERADVPFPLIDAFDVIYSGFAGQPIRAWLLLPAPAAIQRPLPAVVKYVGYGGGRGLVQDHLLWPAAGYAHLVMDTRGQGSAWSQGDTPDVEPDGMGGPQHPGFVTRGIGSPDSWYYRRLYTDAVRAVDAVRAHDAVDPARVVVSGASQGGGMSLAVSALVPDLRAALIDVPFMTHIRRALEVTDAMPYGELTRWLGIRRDAADAALATVEYADGLHFASRARTPSLWSVGLRDEITPPSTVFAAYNHYAGPKEIRVLPWSGHDAGMLQHANAQLAFLEGLGLRDAG
jgi:cephalosporin-C deacetylase